jgi:hypothetical protein
MAYSKALKVVLFVVVKRDMRAVLFVVLLLLLLGLALARKKPQGNEHLSPEEYYEQDRSQYAPSHDEETEIEMPLMNHTAPEETSTKRKYQRPQGADPQPQRRRGTRSSATAERNRNEYENQLFRCYEDLMNCHNIRERHDVMEVNADADSSTRPKTVTAHVLEILHRARIRGSDAEELCQVELLPILTARRTPSQTIASLKRAAEDLRDNRKRPPQANLAVETDSSMVTFEYQFLGPEGKKDCSSCECMLQWQQELTRLAVEDNRSTRRLESQFFKEGSVITVKEFDVVDGSVDSFFVYLGDKGRVGRVEQYRARVRE